MARRSFLAQLAGLPFLALSTKPLDSKKPLNIMMKGAWGPDDPTKGVISISSRARAGGSRAQRADLSALGRYGFDAEVTVNAIFPVGLAAIERDDGKGGGETYSDFLLRGLFARA